MNANETAKRTLRQSLSAGFAATAIGLAVCGDAVAATPSPAAGSAGHALLLFAIAWFFASLRIRKVEGRWRVGFEPSPVKGLTAPSKPMGSPQQGRPS